MTPDDCERIPRACAEKFEEITESLSVIRPMAHDLQKLREAVIGNGKAEASLVFRVRRLEDVSAATRGRWRTWSERLWKLVLAVVLVVFGWWLKSK